MREPCSARRAMVGVTALLALGACGSGEATGAQDVSVRDSAGVTIVETTGAAWADGEGWSIDPEPTLALGAVDGDLPYIFSRVAGALRLPDGGLVVADGQSNQLRFYGADGAFSGTVGREGEGPGEFEFLRGLARCGADSLFAFDLHYNPAIFTETGEFIRETSFPLPGDVTPYEMDCSRGGRYVAVGWGRAPFEGRPPMGFYRAEAPVWILGADGEVLAELGEHLSSERMGSRTGSGPHPFGRASRVAAGDDAVYLTSGERFEIAVYGLDGTLRALHRAPSEDLSILPEHIEAHRRERLLDVAEDRRSQVERSLRDMPMPEGFPAYDELRLDVTGHLWARRFLRPGDGERRWAVFDPEGIFLGHVALPVTMKVTEIGGDYVLGVVRDELDVEQVRLHGLIKGG